MSAIISRTPENYVLPDFKYAVCERRHGDSKVIHLTKEEIDINKYVGIEFFDEAGEYINWHCIDRDYEADGEPVVEIWWYGSYEEEEEND